MEKLTEYVKNGFTYKVIERDKNVAIAEQRIKGGGLCAYEVFIVKQVKETTIVGKLVLEHEAVPGNEEWGSQGWTYSLDMKGRIFEEAKRDALTRARAKMNFILSKNE